MGRTPDKLLRPQWERELLEEARRLHDLGLDALSTLRRARQEHEKPASPESVDRAKAILSTLKWLSTPEAKRTIRAPELTSLTDVEAGAIRAALVAVEAGIPVAAIVSAELEVEETFQTLADRRAGRVASRRQLGSMLDILKREPYALFSFRFRMEFYNWLQQATPKERGRALLLLDSSREDSRLDYLATSVWFAVQAFLALGKSHREAEEAVARGDSPWKLLARTQRQGDQTPLLVNPEMSYSARSLARRARGLPPSGLPRADEHPVAYHVVAEGQGTLAGMWFHHGGGRELLERIAEGARRLAERGPLPAEIRALGAEVLSSLSDLEQDDRIAPRIPCRLMEPDIAPIPPMEVSRVQSLLRRAARNMGLPSRNARSARPGRSKPKTQAQ